MLPAVSRASSYDHCSAKAQMQSMAQKLVVLCARPASPIDGHRSGRGRVRGAGSGDWLYLAGQFAFVDCVPRFG